MFFFARFFQIFLISSVFLLEARVANPSLLFKRLDPYSLSQLSAFIQLHPESHEAQQAKARLQNFMRSQIQDGSSLSETIPTLELHSETLLPFFSLEPPKYIKTQAKTFFDQLHFPNRKLAGYQVRDKHELAKLSAHEIDLGTALIITHNEDPSALDEQLSYYNQFLDTLALNVLFRTQNNKDPERLIEAINHILFFEIGFRFPSETLYKEDIDTYTFLPSVVDQKEGVCLGVCLLYLCLAQRLDLDLKIITPPGHIYLRYEDEKQSFNIETTARGTALPSEVYENLNWLDHSPRTMKEAVGMSHVNRASALLQKRLHEKAKAEYIQAQVYLPNDHLVKELLAYQWIFLKEPQKGYEILKQLSSEKDPCRTYPSVLAKETWQHNLGPEVLEHAFPRFSKDRKHAKENYQALLELKKNYPHLASVDVMLGYECLNLLREKEGQQYLLNYLKKEPNDPSIHHLLCQLYLQNGLIKSACFHYRACLTSLPKNTKSQSLYHLAWGLKLKNPFLDKDLDSI